VRRFARSGLVGLFLIGCRSPDLTGLDPDVPRLPETPPVAVFTSPSAWAGGTFRVRVDGVEAPPPLLELRLGSLRLDLISQGDSTYLGRLAPTAPAGWEEGHVTLEGSEVTLPTLRVLNVRDTRNYPLTTTRRATTRFSIGQNAKLMVPTPDRLVFLDLDVESMVSDERLQSTAPGGPAPTADPLVWVLQPTVDGPLERWRIWPSLDRLDTLPRFGHGHFEAFALLDFEFFLGVTDARRGWVRELRHDATYRDRITLDVIGPQRVVVAPNGGRAILVGYQPGYQRAGQSAVLGVPVLEPATGEVAFTIRNLPNIVAADFARYGQHLAVAGDSATGPARTLRVMDGYGGNLWLDTTYVAPIRGLGFDEYRPLLYVVTGDTPATIDVVVYKQHSGWFEQVGLMSAPCVTGCDGGMLVVSSVLENMYVVGFDSTTGRLTATKFWTPYRWEQL